MLTLDKFEEASEIVKKATQETKLIYSEYFSEMVQTSVNKVYTIDNYGSAMAPFYSVLAIWVGCVILVAIIKVEAEPKTLNYITEGQKYWSRWLLFAIISQLQAAVIVFGDVYLLHCSCDNLLAFWGAGAFTSLVFITLIYSLTLAFGDICLLYTSPSPRD